METQPRHFVSALRASSACRLFQDEEARFSLREERGETVVVVRTRYEQAPEGFVVHRELWLEIAGPGESLDEVMRRHAEVGATVISILTLAANAAVEDLQLELAFDATEGEQEHEFFQNSVLDEGGLPRVGRHPDLDSFLQLFGAITGSPHRDRLLRAASQYKISIQHLQPGQEILALAHLYMAMEVLTPVARNEVIEQHGSRDAVLSSWSISLKDLDSEVRKRVLFQADERAYRESRSASDGFEHGFMDFASIREHALAHARPVAKYAREAILRYSNVDDINLAILSDHKFAEPQASAPMNKYLRATLIGAPEELAPENLQYPMFRVETSIQNTRYDGEQVEVTPTVQITNLIGDKATAKDFTFEFWGPGKGENKNSSGQ